MNFFKRLFSRKKNNESAVLEEESVKQRKDVDFNDPEARSRYVMDCLEQMEIGTREVEMLRMKKAPTEPSLMNCAKVLTMQTRLENAVLIPQRNSLVNFPSLRR